MEGKIEEIYKNLPALMIYCGNCGRRQYGEFIHDWIHKKKSEE